MSSEEHLAHLEAENAHLRALVAELPALRAELAALRAEVQTLRGRTVKDSHNSGKPPSSDGLGRTPRRTRSLRTPSGKKAGGQLGHRGETLHLVATPDQTVEHAPAVCAQCQTPLAEAPVVARDRRQVQEVPPVRLVVTEHQALHVRCPACQYVSVGAFPAAAPVARSMVPGCGPWRCTWSKSSSSRWGASSRCFSTCSAYAWAGARW